jgi:hypothetical protein
MATKTMVGQEDRPDLTVNTEGKSGSEPRELGAILGSSASTAAKLKELPATAIDKVALKDTTKDAIKEHKELKDNKEHKDQKDPKEHKDQKDNKDQKEHKDPKDAKDQKDQKDPKEHKDQKDNKDHKDPKEHKDHKDLKDHKEVLKEIKEHGKEQIEVSHKPEAEIGGGPVETLPPDDVSKLISRVSGLEKAMEEMKKK